MKALCLIEMAGGAPITDDVIINYVYGAGDGQWGLYEVAANEVPTLNDLRDLATTLELMRYAEEARYELLQGTIPGVTRTRYNTWLAEYHPAWPQTQPGEVTDGVFTSLANRITNDAFRFTAFEVMDV